MPFIKVQIDFGSWPEFFRKEVGVASVEEKFFQDGVSLKSRGISGELPKTLLTSYRRPLSLFPESFRDDSPPVFFADQLMLQQNLGQKEPGDDDETVI